MITQEHPAITEFRVAWSRYRVAQDKADQAFARYFTKLQAGGNANGAQASRLSNEANYASADLYTAAGAVWDLDIDPGTIIPEYEDN